MGRGLAVCADERVGGCLVSCGLHADLLILGRKAELDILKGEGLAPSLSQVPEYPHSGVCVCWGCVWVP